MGKSAFARKDTFWNKLRVEKGLTTKEIGELINEDDKKISAYFTGFLLPDDRVISELCELFDVDYNRGNLEFQHAHRQYKAEHHCTLKYSSKPAKVRLGKKHKRQLNTVEDILESLYAVLSCSEFLSIYNALIGSADESIDPFAIIYNKVDYDTYKKIEAIINSTKNTEANNG